MKIVIIGGGVVGTTIAAQLTNEGHNITVVDRSQAVADQISDSLDCMALAGNGASLELMRSERFIEETHILKTEAFTSVLNTYRQAEQRRLTRFTLLRIVLDGDNSPVIDAGNRAAAHLRQDDHLGMGEDGNLYILLPNTSLKSARIVINRLNDYAIRTVVSDASREGAAT